MNKRLLFYTVAAALGGLLFGFDTAVISGTTKFIQPYFGLTDATLGFTVSIALIGTVIGSILIGKPGDKYGRRAMLKLCGVLYIISSIGCAFAANWYALLAEIFPNSIRAKGQALGSFTHWIMNALIAWSFPVVLSSMGGGAAFMF
ncbi:MAG: MFS transporter, partial [Bacteroidota bacterium]|nr:MFS transporter [Bacteroidota bacterium]